MTAQTTTTVPAFESAEFPTTSRESAPNPYAAPLAALVESRQGAAITIKGAADSDDVKSAVNLLRRAANGYGVSLKVKTVDAGTAKAPATRIHFIVVDKITRERKAQKTDAPAVSE